MSDPTINYCYPMTGKPTAANEKLVEIVPNDAFYQAWQASDVPYFGREDSDPRQLEKFWRAHAIEGEPLAIPQLDVDIENGKPLLQFVNGMHRVTNLALMGTESIPAIVRSTQHQALKGLGWIRPLSAENKQKLDGDEDDPKKTFPENQQSFSYKQMFKEWVERNRGTVVKWVKHNLSGFLNGVQGAEQLSAEQKALLAEQFTDFYRDHARTPQRHELQKMISELLLAERQAELTVSRGRVTSQQQRRMDIAAGLEELFAPIPGADLKALTDRQRAHLVDKIAVFQERFRELPETEELKEMLTETQKSGRVAGRGG